MHICRNRTKISKAGSDLSCIQFKELQANLTYIHQIYIHEDSMRIDRKSSVQCLVAISILLGMYLIQAITNGIRSSKSKTVNNVESFRSRDNDNLLKWNASCGRLKTLIIFESNNLIIPTNLFASTIKRFHFRNLLFNSIFRFSTISKVNFIFRFRATVKFSSSRQNQKFSTDQMKILQRKSFFPIKFLFHYLIIEYSIDSNHFSELTRENL